MTSPKAAEKDAPAVCVQCCQEPAVCEMRPTNIPANWSPYCRSCADAEHETCQSVYEHEMKNFGSAYGLPSIEERSLISNPSPSPRQTDTEASHKGQMRDAEDWARDLWKAITPSKEPNAAIYIFKTIVDTIQQDAVVNTEQHEELLRWKKEAVQVFDDLDLQAIGKVLNLKLGDNIAKHILPALQQALAAAASTTEAAQKSEVRYCPSCGRIGETPSQYRDCCPDGNTSRMVRREIAEQAQLGFEQLIGAALSTAQATQEAATQSESEQDTDMDRSTEVTKAINEVIDDGLFPFQAVRLIVWEALQAKARQLAQPSPAAPRAGMPLAEYWADKWFNAKWVDKADWEKNGRGTIVGFIERIIASVRAEQGDAYTFKQALLTYATHGTHDHECNIHEAPKHECDCGLDKLLKEAATPSPPNAEPITSENLKTDKSEQK